MNNTIDARKVEDITMTLAKAVNLLGLMADMYSHTDLYTHFTPAEGERLSNLLLVAHGFASEAYTDALGAVEEAFPG